MPPSTGIQPRLSEPPERHLNHVCPHADSKGSPLSFQEADRKFCSEIGLLVFDWTSIRHLIIRPHHFVQCSTTRKKLCTKSPCICVTACGATCLPSQHCVIE